MQASIHTLQSDIALAKKGTRDGELYQGDYAKEKEHSYANAAIRHLTRPSQPL